MVASSVTFAAVFTWIRIINFHWIAIQVFHEAFVANVTFCRVPVFLAIFICHNKRPFVHHIFTHFSFMVLKICEKYKDRVFSSVYDGALCLSITPHDEIRKAAWLMLLHFDCEASLIVWLASGYLSHNTLKVCINRVWGFHLLVVVFESHLVFSLFRHLCSGWTFQQSFAFRFVPVKKISGCVTMKAAFAEMFSVWILALVI